VPNLLSNAPRRQAVWLGARPSGLYNVRAYLRLGIRYEDRLVYVSFSYELSFINGRCPVCLTDEADRLGGVWTKRLQHSWLI
jgi:hypothetical protein